MSQTLAATSGTAARRGATRWVGPQDARTAARSGARPALRVVAAPVLERSRTVFVVCCLMLLVGGLIALLLVNTALAQGSFRLHDLRASSAVLDDQAAALREDIALRSSPDELADAARRLAMVPSDSVAFLRLSDGKVLGVAKPAKAPPARTVTASTQSEIIPTTAAGTGTMPAEATAEATAKATTTSTDRVAGTSAAATGRSHSKPTTAPTTTR